MQQNYPINSSFDIYEMVTNLIVERLEIGVVSWQMHWKAEAGISQNMVHQKVYKGFNFLLLLISSVLHSFSPLTR